MSLDLIPPLHMSHLIKSRIIGCPRDRDSAGPGRGPGMHLSSKHPKVFLLSVLMRPHLTRSVLYAFQRLQPCFYHKTVWSSQSSSTIRNFLSAPSSPVTHTHHPSHIRALRAVFVFCAFVCSNIPSTGLGWLCRSLINIIGSHWFHRTSRCLDCGPLNKTMDFFEQQALSD